MVIERAEFQVVAGREAAFEAAMAEGIRWLAGARDCLSARLGQGIENPSKFVLLLEWESVEAHVAFTKTPEFSRFRELASGYFAGPAAMEHFRPVAGDGAASG